MDYWKYFYKGQHILLRNLVAEDSRHPQESVQARVVQVEGHRFEVALACQGRSALPSVFLTGAPLQLSAEFGTLGLRSTVVALHCPSPTTVFLETDGTLEIIYRRSHQRCSLLMWLGVRCEQGDLPALRRLWEQGLELLAAGGDPSELTTISRQTINLGAGGVRLSLPAPMAPDQFCLLFLLLEDRQPTICALGQVVWTEAVAGDGNQLCGVKFIGILEADCKRIDRHVNACCRERMRTGESGPTESSFTV